MPNPPPHNLNEPQPFFCVPLVRLPTMRLSVLLFTLAFTPLLSAQETAVNDIHTLFELKADSLVQRITVNRWGIDTSYYMHYTVKNRSNDTLTYITNSCFYYNHSWLTVGDLELDLNPEGGCSFNALEPHRLAPGESFEDAQWLTAYNLWHLDTGVWRAQWPVPLVHDRTNIYRVDGRSFVHNAQILIYTGTLKVAQTEIYTFRRKRKNRKGSGKKS